MMRLQLYRLAACAIPDLNLRYLTTDFQSQCILTLVHVFHVITLKFVRSWMCTRPSFLVIPLFQSATAKILRYQELFWSISKCQWCNKPIISVTFYNSLSRPSRLDHHATLWCMQYVCDQGYESYGFGLKPHAKYGLGCHFVHSRKGHCKNMLSQEVICLLPSSLRCHCPSPPAVLLQQQAPPNQHLRQLPHCHDQLPNKCGRKWLVAHTSAKIFPWSMS